MFFVYVPGLRLVWVILSSGNISSSSANCMVSMAPWYLSTSFLKSAAIPVNFPSCKDMFLATSGTVNPRCSRCLTSAKVSDKSVVKLTRYLSAHESGFGGKVRSRLRVKFASERKKLLNYIILYTCLYYFATKSYLRKCIYVRTKDIANPIPPFVVSVHLVFVQFIKKSLVAFKGFWPRFVLSDINHCG